MATGLEGILISRKGAPLVIGRSPDSISVSSDVQPFYGACSEVAYMEDGDNLLLTKEGVVSPTDYETPVFEPLQGVYDEEDPGIFPHMMLKKSMTNQPPSQMLLVEELVQTELTQN